MYSQVCLNKDPAMGSQKRENQRRKKYWEHVSSTVVPRVETDPQTLIPHHMGEHP